MNYRETLNKAKELNLSIIDLMVAEEVSCQFDSLSSEDFELVCETVKTVFMKTERVDIGSIACGISCEIKRGELSLDMIKNGTCWDESNYDLIDVICQIYA